MIDTKQSFRKGSVITEVHVEEYMDGKPPLITRVPTDFGTINKAKKANRVTQYRVVRK